MKKTLIVLAIISTSFAHANSAVQLLDFTLSEVLYVGALTAASSEVSSRVTSSADKKQAAMLLQNEILSYYQSGKISPYLQYRIDFVKTIDSTISLNESIDALLSSTEIVLNQ
jgi:hypothetical protein